MFLDSPFMLKDGTAQFLLVIQLCTTVKETSLPCQKAARFAGVLQQNAKAIKATVKKVQPWRERTQVQLVTDSGLDQDDLALAQRVSLFVPEPPSRVQGSKLPTDIGRRHSKSDRVDWFLASTYCTCKVKGDRCTGMFYSLASCDINACGMPNRIRALVGKMIDKGLSDEQIMQDLLKQRGSNLLKPHLLP